MRDAVSPCVLKAYIAIADSRVAAMEAKECSQGDGRAAVGEVNGQPLCVDCFTKLQRAHAEQQALALQLVRHSMAMANQALADMESVTGLYGLNPRIQIPNMPVTGPVTFNNFKLDNSTVGAINTGNVHTIDTTVTALRTAGIANAAKALHDFTQAVLGDKTLTAVQKNELLEQVAFLSEQAVSSKERKPGMIMATLDGITKMAAAVSGIAAAWHAAEPIIRGIFGP